jgi:hypothetical protein
MQDLKVVGVQSGALLLAADDGTEYRLAVDEALQSKVRQAQPVAGAADRKLAPKDVQAHIRAGMSAEEVATLTGAPLDYIRRFEGPIVAEREHIVESALNVPVSTAADPDPLGEPATFGSVIRQRLADGGAVSERWAGWKEPGGGWIVKLTFTAEQVDRDARWSFDPRRQALAPLNGEATALSQQGEQPQSLIPRLRAVPLDGRRDEADSPRFDSGAFAVAERGDGLIVDAIPFTREEAPQTHTADLLEALRRRRGEREAVDAEGADEAARAHEEAKAAHPSTGSIRLVDVPLDGMPEVETAEPDARGGDDREAEPDAERETRHEVVEHARTGTRDTGGQPRLPRKGRAAMPSWDEIVFGARSDDD